MNTDIVNKQVVGRLQSVFDLFYQKAVLLLPNLFVALAVIAGGLLLAFFLRFLVRRLIGGLMSLLPPRLIGSSVDWANVGESAREWIGSIVFWMINVFFLTVSSEILGLSVVTTWLSGLANYMPNILVGALIAFVGYLIAKLVSDIVEGATVSAGFQYGKLLANFAYGAILIISLLIAIGQVGIDVQFLSISIFIVFGAFLMGGAISFALGAKSIVSNILSSYYLQKTYRVGQTLRVDGVEGQVVEITSTAVILKTDEGLRMIPAKVFSESSSVALSVGN